MADDVLHHARIAAGHQEPRCKRVAQIVQPVRLRELRFTLERGPAAIERFGREIVHPRAGPELVSAAQQRGQLRHERHVTHAGRGLGRLREQLMADANTCAANVHNACAQIHVLPLQAADLAAAQPGEGGQGEAEILQHERQGGGVILIGERAARLFAVLRLIQRIDGRPADQAGAQRAPEHGMQERERQLRAAAAVIGGQEQDALHVFGRDRGQIEGAEHGRDEGGVQMGVGFAGFRLQIAFVERGILSIPLVIGHLIFPPVMRMKYTIVPLPEGPFEYCDPLSRMAFGLIWDRYKVSDYNVTGEGADSAWYDEVYDDVFCVYNVGELARKIGCSERTARRCLDDLLRQDVIYWRRAEYGGANRYYFPQRIKDYMRRETTLQNLPD